MTKAQPQTDDDDHQEDAHTVNSTRRKWLAHAFGFGVVPFVALVLALGAGYLKFENATATAVEGAAVESVEAAKESTIAMLSYTPDTADAKLAAARDRLTGTFRDSYTTLTTDVVIPGAKEKQISAAATVTGAASVSASYNHAVVLIFVNQHIVMGNDRPTDTASVVEVTLDNIAGRWLISGFDPR
jgi:Mce-associated membrane protein